MAMTMVRYVKTPTYIGRIDIPSRVEGLADQDEAARYLTEATYAVEDFLERTYCPLSSPLLQQVHLPEFGFLQRQRQFVAPGSVGITFFVEEKSPEGREQNRGYVVQKATITLGS